MMTRTQILWKEKQKKMQQNDSEGMKPHDRVANCYNITQNAFKEIENIKEERKMYLKNDHME